jgi:hypothetical protein
MRRVLLPALLLIATALGIAAALSPPRRASAQCAFPFIPTTYEDFRDRQLYLDTIGLAAYNMLFPEDPDFALPPIEAGTRGSRYLEQPRVPPVLLKSIAWVESRITQAATSVPFGSIGPALITFDCGHGIAQVTTGMTAPAGENGLGSPDQALIATHFAYNVAGGARLLAEKWNFAPEARPIAGIDTGGHPSILENWYFALWSYNGFTGPGANTSNHPLDPIYGAWPRQPFSCGPTSDGLGHNRANYPYQELIFGCAAHPPLVDGTLLWTPQPITLPDLNDPRFRGNLSLSTFAFPYSRMDIITPQPFHLDETPQPDPALRDQVLGASRMGVNRRIMYVDYQPGVDSATVNVNIKNRGAGVLTWYAVSSVPWISLNPYTSVSVGFDVACAEGVPCDRVGHMQVRVDPNGTPPEGAVGHITVWDLSTGRAHVIEVNASPYGPEGPD